MFEGLSEIRRDGRISVVPETNRLLPRVLLLELASSEGPPYTVRSRVSYFYFRVP